MSERIESLLNITLCKEFLKLFNAIFSDNSVFWFFFLKCMLIFYMLYFYVLFFYVQIKTRNACNAIRYETTDSGIFKTFYTSGWVVNTFYILLFKCMCYNLNKYIFEEISHRITCVSCYLFHFIDFTQNEIVA